MLPLTDNLDTVDTALDAIKSSKVWGGGTMAHLGVTWGPAHACLLLAHRLGHQRKRPSHRPCRPRGDQGPHPAHRRRQRPGRPAPDAARKTQCETCRRTRLPRFRSASEVVPARRSRDVLLGARAARAGGEGPGTLLPRLGREGDHRSGEQNDRGGARRAHEARVHPGAHARGDGLHDRRDAERPHPVGATPSPRAPARPGPPPPIRGSISMPRTDRPSTARSGRSPGA